MKIKKILIYLIFAFVMIMPFSVSADDVEYDFKFDTSFIQQVDYNWLNKLKVQGYNAVINSTKYKNSHEVIESYNEFYLNNGYFIAYGPSGRINIYYDLSGKDYIKGAVVKLGCKYHYGDTRISNFLGIFYFYDIGFEFDNTDKAIKELQGVFGWTDKNINNSDFVHDYTLDNLLSTNKDLPVFKYPILATNRSVEWVDVDLYNDNSPYQIAIHNYVLANIYKGNFTEFGGHRITAENIFVKTLNSKVGNKFFHPYVTEETEKQESNKTSTIISINTSNYSSLKIKYNLSDKLKRGFWDYAIMANYDKKTTLDWLNIEVNSTNPINYPRRYSGYVKGNEIEYQKEPNDFGNTVLSTSFKSSMYLYGYKGVKNGYFNFDLKNLPENTIITIYLEYDPTYVEIEPIELPEVNFSEYNMTSKYAVGLVPKFSVSNNYFSLLYKGNFTTYYAFNSDNYNVKDAEILNSLDDFNKKTLNFSAFNDVEKYQNPIFYVINNNYANDTVSIIKYSSAHFELLEFESIDSVVTSTHNGSNYIAPSNDYNSSDSGINSDSGSNVINNFNFSDLFKSLPDFIVGLGSAFTAVSTCVTIAFSSLPEMVQSVLWFCLVLSAFVLAIKFFKG